jgi:hypothetical protein
MKIIRGAMPMEAKGERILTIAAALAMAAGLVPCVQFARGGSRGNPLLPSTQQKESRQMERPPAYDTSEYDRLLRTYVNDQGWVDYAGLARERAALNRFLEQIANISPNLLKHHPEQLAFWINTYNACTLADVLDTVYDKHKSVRQVSGFFDGRKHAVAGEQLTLDEIEKRGRDLHDPRIHFAIVCASTSCPKLQRFAYTGQALERQLDQAATAFLADPKRGLRFDLEHKELSVSPIFKWYAGDFTGNSSAAGSLWARAKATVSGGELLDFVARYAPDDVAQAIRENRPALHYFSYDWSLNSLETHASGGRP